MKRLLCVLALSGAFVANPAFAWGSDGHRAVGAIAEQLIKGSNAEQHVRALLLPGETLESVTNWADCVKGTYCGPQTPEMEAYVAANSRHSEYHYTDIPFQNEHYHDGALGSAEVDIVQTLKQAIAVLQGQGDAAHNPHQFTQRQALLLVAHLVGDIHQPLHVGAAFVSKDGAFVVPREHRDVDTINIFDARGGNNLLLDDEKISNLSAAVIPGAGAAPAPGMQKSPTKPFHSYWDTTVVDYAMRRLSTRTPEQFAKKVIDDNPAVTVNEGAPATWPYQWADDALAASKLAYTGVTASKRVAQTSKKGEVYYTFALDITANYPVPSSALAKAQLIKGGYHLRDLLRAIWP